MSREDLELFMLEYALLVLQGEMRNFSKFYNTDLFSVDYEIKDNKGTAYLITPKDKKELVTIEYKDAPYIIQHPYDITQDPFMALVEEFELQAPPVEVPPIVIQNVSTEEDSNNE